MDKTFVLKGVHWLLNLGFLGLKDIIKGKKRELSKFGALITICLQFACHVFSIGEVCTFFDGYWNDIYMIVLGGYAVGLTDAQIQAILDGPKE